ncbi:MAG TPA: hypothetical protein VHZ76_07945, partial [Gammaproteobacteria bacterium]|nr:hypothetical protein [Gammaproteobacteria bacterium]
YATKVDYAILDTAFHLPHPKVGQPVYGVAKLENGFAIVAVNAIKPGEVTDPKQRAVFNEQVQNSLGLLEYELYKESQLQNAKIVVHSQ